ncbi:hypothetical protein C8J56DRAFT_1169809 [Mycena floridula]|nr:hypothetical protein C8J56DRAFT_1169809 [Mycena floridula]
MKLKDVLTGLSIQIFIEGEEGATAEMTFKTFSDQWSIRKRKKSVPTGQCYIQSEAGKSFQIGWDNDSGFTYSMKILIDGEHLVDHAVEPHTTEKCLGVPTTTNRQGSGVKRAYRAFTFTSNSAVERAGTSQTSRQKTGTIIATIYRCVGPVKHRKIEDELARCKQNTGSSGGVITGKIVADPSPNDEFVLDFKTEDFPCACFEFNYADLGIYDIFGSFLPLDCHTETLRALGVMKKSSKRQNRASDDGSSKRRKIAAELDRSEGPDTVQEVSNNRRASSPEEIVSESITVPRSLAPSMRRRTRPAAEQAHSDGPSRVQQRPNTRRSSSTPLEIVSETITIPRPLTQAGSLSMRQLSQRQPLSHSRDNAAGPSSSNCVRSPSLEEILSISSATLANHASGFKREAAQEDKFDPNIPVPVLKFLRGSGILKGNRVLEVGRMFRTPGGIRSAGQLDVLARDEQDNPELVDTLLRTMGLTLFEVMDVRKLLKLRRRNLSLPGTDILSKFE